jgi:hypothetical protein
MSKAALYLFLCNIGSKDDNLCPGRNWLCREKCQKLILKIVAWRKVRSSSFCISGKNST